MEVSIWFYSSIEQRFIAGCLHRERGGEGGWNLTGNLAEGRG